MQSRFFISSINCSNSINGRQAGRQPCHQSVQFSSVEFRSVQFSSVAEAAQIASDMSLFIGNSINCRSSSTAASTIESTTAVRLSSATQLASENSLLQHRIACMSQTRLNFMSVVHVASFIVLRTGPEALSFYPWTLLLKCLHSSFAEMREEPVAVIDNSKDYSDYVEVKL